MSHESSRWQTDPATAKTQLSPRLAPTGVDSIQVLAKEPPPPSAAPLLGRFALRDYTVLTQLAAGAMGTVYIGESLKTGERVAIKLVRLASDDPTSRRERFRREWDVISGLHHQNIVRGDSFQVFGDTCCLVMEYVNGPNLQSLVKQQGPLHARLASTLIRQAAEGLAHAHAHGVIHRDVKPSNLLLASGGVVKVIDFGVALISSVGPASLTLSYEDCILGTADYMAPEQSLACHAVDARADLYSLGCTLYFLLSGFPPFSEGTFLERLEKHRTEQPTSLSFYRRDVPAELVDICRRLMAKEPADRYPDAASVVAAIGDWLEQDDQNRPSEAAREDAMQIIHNEDRTHLDERSAVESGVHRLLASLRKALFVNRLSHRDGQIARRILALLEELRDEVALFLTLDEACGELERIVMEVPRLGEQAAGLEAENEALFESLCRFCERVEESCNSAFTVYSLDDCERDFNQFEESYLNHQRRIAELVVRSLYDDVGVGD